MTPVTSLVARLGDESFPAEVGGDGAVRIQGWEEVYAVAAGPDGSYLVTAGDRRWRVTLAGGGERSQAFVDGEVYDLQVDTRARPRPARGTGVEAVSAPMPARVVKILVEPGQSVRRGDLVVTLEAMKMELPIGAPRDGRVRRIACREGELVQPGVSLLEIE